MKLRPPNEHPDEDAEDVCPLCARDLNNEGDCAEHGSESDWRRFSSEELASYYVKESDE